MVIANGLWVIVIKSETYPRLLVLSLQSFPILAAFVVAYLSPSRKFLLGISIAVLGAMLTSIANEIYNAFGLPVDFSGFKGAITVFEISIVSNAVLCTFGSAVGYFITRKKIT